MLKLENGREVLFSGRVDNADVPWITDRIKSVVEVCHSIHGMPSFDTHHPLISLRWSRSFLFRIVNIVKSAKAMVQIHRI